MKKFTFIFAFVALAFGFTYSQATFVVATPTANGTSANRLPNGTSGHAYFRGASLVRTTELTSMPVSTTLSSVGFTTSTGATTGVTGSITIYMENTGDVTFNKGLAWSGVTPGMTIVYTGTMMVPASATTVDLPLSTPFVYTGGGIYVAYEWQSAGPYSTGAAIWSSNTDLPNGCISGPSATAFPTTCVASGFRPCMRFGFPNALTNDVSVEYINTMGAVAQVLTIPTVPISAIIRNNSNGTLSNIPVSANMTGVNTFANTQTVTSLAAGATATVTFPAWSPTTAGASTISVTVPSDQNNGNNMRTFNNVVSCNVGGFAQKPANFTQSIGFNTTSGILSTQVQLPVTATVTGVNMAISSNTAAVGNTVYGVMLDNAGTILTTSSNSLTISNGDLNTIYSFTFATPQAVTAAQIWYIGMAQPANATLGYFPFGAYSSGYLNSAYYTNAITGGTVALLTTNLGQFGIEAVFGGVCGPMGVASVKSSDSNLSVYPNPANTSLFVKLGSVSDKATVEVYNAIGQVVISAKEINDASAELNVSNLVKGVYILKVTNGKEVSNTKIVIEH